MKLNKISILIFVLALCSTQISKSMYGSKGISVKEARAAAQKEHRLMYLNERLWDASIKGNYDDLKYAIDEGANVNYKTVINGSTPLHNAVLGNHLDLVELLIAKKADVNAENFYNQNPLLYAAKYGNLKIVNFLLNNGADITAKAEGIDAIQMAVQNKHYEVANFLKGFKEKRTKEILGTTLLIPDLVSIVEEYEGYKEPKIEVECEAE